MTTRDSLTTQAALIQASGVLRRSDWLRLLAFPMRTTPLVLQVIELEISRFPYKERLCMPGSQTTPGQTGARADAPVHVAFHASYRVGTRDKITYAARWLACTIPCRRFTGILTDVGARLGGDADR